ncbi:hypothetical protein [Marinobacter salicampi]|uniref:hypothetical protein n=1 Tax=Marinobacter salicampi TaxID=435907 RepID=UPI00140B0928|nr:hypothetical protein [Marinobacter salicampi]
MTTQDNNLKDRLTKKLEAQTDHWSQRIEKLRTEAETEKTKAKDDQAQAEIERDFNARIRELENNIDEAKRRTREIEAASDTALDEMERHIEDWIPGSQTGHSKT